MRWWWWDDDDDYIADNDDDAYADVTCICRCRCRDYIYDLTDYLLTLWLLSQCGNHISQAEKNILSFQKEKIQTYIAMLFLMSEMAMTERK